MGWLILIAALVGLFTVPGTLEFQRRKIGPKQRDGAPGALAELSQGGTWYRWHGPKKGAVIVAIHGLSTPSVVWSALIPGLTALGFRVLTYDLYGRGLSDAPKGPQDRAFFLRQLADLLADQKVKGKVTLMGYSMGGSIAAAYADRHPESVERLILLAPAGVETAPSNLQLFARNTPVIGDWLHHVVGIYGLKRGIDTCKTNPRVRSEITDGQLGELTRRGFADAVLSSFRHILSERLAAEHRQIAKDKVPVVAIWGQEDQIIPIAARDMLVKWNPDARQHVLEDAEHGLAYTHAPEILDILKRELKPR